MKEKEGGSCRSSCMSKSRRPSAGGEGGENESLLSTIARTLGVLEFDPLLDELGGTTKPRIVMSTTTTEAAMYRTVTVQGVKHWGEQ